MSAEGINALVLALIPLLVMMAVGFLAIVF
jgi:hypothetical protein